MEGGAEDAEWVIERANETAIVHLIHHEHLSPQQTTNIHSQHSTCIRTRL